MIIDLAEKDVYTNLATEQWYTDYATGPILLLWQSDQAVVMGKIKTRGGSVGSIYGL